MPALFMVLGIAGVSLLLRLAFSLHTTFGDDSIRLYEQALDLYLHGNLALEGAKVVYSGTALPGSLQQLLLALPLWLSSGLPWGPGVFIALINFGSTALTYVLYSRLFPALHKPLLAILIFLAPWSILHTPVWNPSFLPFLFLVLIFGLFQLHKPSLVARFCGGTMIGFSFTATLQLHLSVVLLGIVVCVALAVGWVSELNFRQRFEALLGAALGAGVGAITLIPYFLGKPDAGFVSSNVVFELRNFSFLPSYFLRFLSFPTSEVTRFLGSGHGFKGAMALLREIPILIPFALPALIASIWLAWKGLRFFFSRENWKPLFERSSLDLEGRFRLLVLIVPVLSGFTFLFSIKGPSAHTFWILFPLSFYPLLHTLWREGWLTAKRRQLYFWSCYTACALVFSIGGYLPSNVESLLRTQTLAQEVARGALPEEAVPETLRAGVRAVLRALGHSK